MRQASVQLRPCDTISGTVLTPARLPIVRIFDEIPLAGEHRVCQRAAATEEKAELLRFQPETIANLEQRLCALIVRSECDRLQAGEIHMRIRAAFADLVRQKEQLTRLEKLL